MVRLTELMLRSVETRCGLLTLVEEDDMVNCVVVAEFRAIQQNVTNGTEIMD